MFSYLATQVLKAYQSLKMSGIRVKCLDYVILHRSITIVKNGVLSHSSDLFEVSQE